VTIFAVERGSLKRCEVSEKTKCCVLCAPVPTVKTPLYFCSTRVIARRSLLRFVEGLRGQTGQRAVKAALDAWFHEAQRAQWTSSAD
jgi:hypothetical protein